MSIASGGPGGEGAVLTGTGRAWPSRWRPSGRPGSGPRAGWSASSCVASSRTRWKALCISFCSLALTCSSLHMNCWMSCTHSKYDTVTPPALQSTSGMTKMSVRARIASASGVVGPLAPSARIRHFRRPAFSAVMTRSSAAGTSTVQGVVSSSFGVDLVRARELHDRPAVVAGRRRVAEQRGDVDAALVADGAVAVADGDDLHAALGAAPGTSPSRRCRSPARPPWPRRRGCCSSSMASRMQ